MLFSYMAVGLFSLAEIVITAADLGACGVRNTDGNGWPSTNYIVGGTEALRNEFPWQVSLQVYHPMLPDGEARWKHICGGSVITETWILTAAHCVVSSASSRDLHVVAGVHHRYERTNKTYVGKLADIIIHPEWNIRGVQNDIALLKLASPLELHPSHIYPICLPPFSGKEGAENITDLFSVTPLCVASGWGKTAQNGGESEALLKVDLPIVPSEACREAYRKVLPSSLATFNTKLCAGRMDVPGFGVCQADSGGPLACAMLTEKTSHISERELNHSTLSTKSRFGKSRTSSGVARYVLAGVNSFGRVCGSPQYPAVFSRISWYRPWIDSVIQGFP